MTPKQKAEELVVKYLKLTDIYFGNRAPLLNPEEAKACAIIAVDELIDHCSFVEPSLGVEFWEEVRQEIEKL